MFVQGEERAFCALVTEVGEVCAGGPWRVDVEHVRAPIGVHVGLAMGGFNDYSIEAAWVLSVCEEEGAVVEVYSARTDDEGEVFALEHGGGSGVPEFAEGFASEESVGEQAYATGHGHRGESSGVEGAAYGGGDGCTDSGIERGLCGGSVDDGNQRAASVTGLLQGL